MAKSSRQEIEKDEKSVIYELMKDSSQSINIISKKLGFSRQKVWRIIKKLQQEKTIWGYTAIIENEKLGMKAYVIIGKRTTKPVPKEKLEPVIKKGFEELAKSSNCILDDTYYLNGEYDFLTIFKAKNLQDAKKFQEEFNRLYIGFIQKTQLFEVLFPLRVKGIFNPNAEKLAEFF
ncbi:MAG: Lrp/AsnC family transcriptional regulator [Thermoplasmatota archaeon]|jgi:DNA-binding Lrp family transcriptional regulator